MKYWRLRPIDSWLLLFVLTTNKSRPTRVRSTGMAPFVQRPKVPTFYVRMEAFHFNSTLIRHSFEVEIVPNMKFEYEESIDQFLKLRSHKNEIIYMIRVTVIFASPS